jgi:hypothetical protein
MKSLRNLFVQHGLFVFLLLAIACDNSSPTAPSVTEAAGSGSNAAPGTPATASAISAPDGSTLKTDAPAPLSPIADQEVSTARPVLTVSNAGARFVDVALTLSYDFEVSIAGGSGVVVDQGTEPSGTGTTSHTVATALDAETPYRWRARARLDSDAGPWSDWVTFQTTALQISAPNLLNPADGDLINSIRPILEVENPIIGGDTSDVVVEFQIAADPAFAIIVAQMSEGVGRHAGIDTPLTGTPQTALSRDEKTSAQANVDLEYDTTYYWRARATNGTVLGEYSGVRSFLTSAQAAAGGGGGGGSSPGTAEDQINLSQVVWLHHNVSSWPQTSTVTSTTVGAPPICVNHTKAGQWPKVSIFNGVVIEANVWVFGNIGGTWYAATWEWLRPGDTCKPLDGSDFRTHVNGASPLSSWTPKSGEKVGLMVSTPARFGPDGPKNERSNVVVVTWP